MIVANAVIELYEAIRKMDKYPEMDKGLIGLVDGEYSTEFLVNRGVSGAMNIVRFPDTEDVAEAYVMQDTADSARFNEVNTVTILGIKYLFDIRQCDFTRGTLKAALRAVKRLLIYDALIDDLNETSDYQNTN